MSAALLLTLRLPDDSMFRMSGKAELRPSTSAGAAEAPSESAVLAALASGERWAADALYRMLRESVTTGLQRVLHDSKHDYDDLFQTTFERIVRALFEHRTGNVLSLRAWASGIAAHVALDALRARVRERKLFAREEADATPVLEIAGSASLERQLEARRQLLVVQDVLAAMTPELAEAVVLHDLIGHDLSQVAALSHVTVAAAQSRLVRGRKELLRRAEKRRLRGTR